MILILKQQLQSGRNKTWKLRPAQAQYSFGASRLADVISLDPQSPGIEGVFQYRDHQWWYIGMTEQTLQTLAGPCRKSLTSSEQIKLGSSVLKIELVERDSNLAEALTTNTFTTGQDKNDLIIVKRNGKIIATKVVESGAEVDSQWQDPIYEVLRKAIHTDGSAHLSKIEMSDIIDKESRRQVGAVLGLTALFVIGGLFGPKNKPQMAQAPKRTQSIVIRTEVKPKEKTPEQKPQNNPVQQVALSEAPAAASGRVSDKVKALSGGRISQLLGKVSAQAAKSANIFVGQGVKAGEGASGRAVASLGAVNRAGAGFGSGAAGEVTISTAGRGGGRSVSGMGGLVAGKTGNGGVGLIEEESEISGGLDREVIAQYIKSQLGNILYCYERQLSAQPDLFGKVAVRFTIGPNGGIEARSIGDSTLKNSTVEGCILQKVSAWKFPSPQGGTRVMVTYPFLFKSTN